MGEGSDCVIKGSSASAGDFWHSLEVVGESSAVNEVGQCKLYKDRGNLMQEEPTVSIAILRGRNSRDMQIKSRKAQQAISNRRVSRLEKAEDNGRTF